MYKFPVINHLDDVRHAISDDFYLAVRDWGYVINYYINAFPEINNTMSDDQKELEYIRREFRGIKFDLDGNILARPFSKFFNWGEKEAEMALFDFNQPFVIMDKLDGSMIHPMLVDDKIYWATKMGAEDFDELVKSFVEKSDIDYNSFAREMIDQGYTPLFEFVSPAKRIVVGYEKTDLILTAIRNNVTGQYVDLHGQHSSQKG
jgi:RNA ligase